LQPRHVDGVLYVDFYGISTVNKLHPLLYSGKWGKTQI
jgi:hypothetical protein